MDDADDERSAASAKSSKSIKSLTKTMKALEKDNRRLKKSVSALQKCDEDIIVISRGINPLPKGSGNPTRFLP